MIEFLGSFTMGLVCGVLLASGYWWIVVRMNNKW